MPGITKPATPTTSLVFTEIARIPSGIVGGSPPPDAERRELGLGERLVLGHLDDGAAIEDVLNLGERARAPGSAAATAPASRDPW